MPGGRPTDYLPEFAEQARKLCLLGSTDAELADFFEVTEQTVNNWKNAHPEFFESIKSGRVKADSDVAQSLYNKALGGDSVACIFWLKNRRKDSWRDKQELEHSGEIKEKRVLSDI